MHNKHLEPQNLNEAPGLLVCLWHPPSLSLGFPSGLVRKESACNAEENDNTLQYHCLENPMDRGAWRLPSIGSPRVRHH